MKAKIVKHIHILFLYISFMMLVGCFDSGGGGEDGGGGLFNNHVLSENAFYLIPSADKNYVEGQSFFLSIRHFSKITVTGTPRLELNINGSTVYADYFAGSGSETISFRYTVQAGENDLDGIDISPNIDLNGGTMTFAMNGVVQNAPVSFTPLDTNNIYIDTIKPSITIVLPPTPRKYVLGEKIQFFTNFDEAVLVTGSPRIAIDINGITKYAHFISGDNSTSLVFQYTVTSSDLDLDGISIATPIELNAGSIQDAFGNDANLTFVPVPMPTTLVDGDTPFVTAVSPSTNKTYLAGEVIKFIITFSENVIVSGTPRIPFNISADSRYLDYVSGSGSKNLLFEYNVTLGENDYDGISLGNVIDFNGGAIQDASANLIVQNFTSPLTPGILVDAKEPKVININPPAANTYYVGQGMYFIVNFDRDVNIVGTPRLPILLNSDAPTPVYADYLSGNGTSSIIFQYIVQNSKSDPDGITIANYLELNGGTIRGNNLLDASLDLSTPVSLINTSGVLIDSVLPMITGLTVPTDNNYISGNNLDFVVAFNKNVNVLNSPRIELNIGGTTRYADYLIGSGTSNLTFRYTVVGGDLDADGIQISSTSIDLNTIGSIKDINGNNSTLNLTAFIPSLAGVVVNSSLVKITSITPPSDNTYIETNNLSFIVNISEAVNVTGSPRIAINIGGTPKYAVYASGTGSSALTFTYTVEVGLSDTDGITISSPLELNGGAIQNATLDNLVLTFTPPVMTNVLVDSSVPTVAITSPANNSYINSTTDSATFSVTGTCSEVGQTVLIKVDTLAAASPVGFICDGTNFTGTIDTTGLTEASHAFVAEIQDAAFNTGSSSTNNIIKDVTAPTMTGLTPPSDGTFITSNNLDFIVHYNQNVSMTNSARIQIDIGGTTKYADYFSGTGTSSITFRYTVTAPDSDNDGITIGNNSIDLNTTGVLADLAGNNAGLDMTTFIPSLANVFVNVNPVTISSVTPPADATYTQTQNIDFIINISENVNVTGNPQITIDIGGTTKYATYLSGTGTSALTFRYTVESGLYDNNGISVTSPLGLNGGTIQNAGLENLNLIFTPPVMPNILVDSMPPSISSVTPPADSTYVETNNLDFIIITSENVDVTGSPQLQINIGGTIKYATYLSGTGTSALTFRYTIEAGLYDNDGITTASPLILNGGTIQNASLQNLLLTFTPPIMSNVFVDSVVPTISSVTPPADNTYIDTNNLDFVVNTSENVDVTGTPRLILDIGGITKYATYLSGTGTSALTFRYTIEAGLSDPNGIGLSSPVDLNGGSIQNASLENLTITFTPPPLANVLVDSSDPTVAIINPTDSSYINSINDSATFTISGTCSENLQTVTIEVDAGAATSPTGFACNGTNFSGTVDTTGLAEGVHTFVAKISDAALNQGISTTINVTKETSIPTVTSVTVPIPNNYIVGSNLDFIVNLDENTNVAGTPRLSIDIGGVTKYATYVSGTGSSALTFRYTVQAGDYDTNGLGYVSNAIALNGGTLLDVANNPANLNLEATVTLPSLASVLVYGILPTVAITSAPDITAANETSYSVTGTCSEDTRTVTVNIDGLSYTPSCTSGTWTTGSVNVSSRLDNANLPITADHTDVAGNNATQASITVNKDTTNPTVTITFSPDISAANDTNYAASGTCTDVGQIVSVVVGVGDASPVNISPNCAGGTWTTGPLDVSGLAEGTITIEADHLTATTASVNINKDTLSSIVVISSSPNISISNQTSYIASGTCSDNGVMVDVNIGTLNFTPNCNTGSWTTGVVDVSSLPDGAVLVTADHATATQATANITKNTSTPTVDSLSVATTLADSINISWNLNDPGGYTINDYQVNYRVKGTGTWLTFSDGVSTNTYATITGLTASTYYETRVRVQYDTSNYSDWTSTAEGLTKPDNPLFTSPYMAMNVGGSTVTKVVAMYDNTRIYHNGVEVAGSPISKGTPFTVPGGTTQFDTIDADGPIYTAGNKGGTNTGAGAANIVWQPTSWAGETFSFNAIRSNPQELYVYATENATVTIKSGATILAGPTAITAGNGATLTWSVFGSYQVISTGTILAYHASNSTTDPKPLLPSSLEIIGFPSNSMRLTADVDATNYYGIHADSVTTSGNLNKPDSIQINPSGGSQSLYGGNSLLISADQNIAGASFADSNGSCAAPFLPTNLMKKKYMINNSADYVAFASKLSGTIDVYDSTQTIGVSTPIQTLTLTRSGANPNAPYKARVGTTPGGYRFVSTVPVAGWYQPNNSIGSGDQDETILYGTDD